MSPLGRALLGAILGALLTLGLHPASRPFILGVAGRVSASELLATVDTHAGKIQPPEDLLGASMWLQLGLERTVSDRDLSKRELASLLNVADAAIERERQNAFWHQAKAALLLRDGRLSEAQKSWNRGARCDTWRDYQTERLQKAQQALAVRTRAAQAWQHAFVYYARSEVSAMVIEEAGRLLLAGSDYASDAGRAMRYDTLMNGDLMRKGGRSIPISLRGANMVELSAYPALQTGAPSPKRLWVGQNAFLTSLKDAGLRDEASRASAVFRQNEGWVALVDLDHYGMNAAELGRTSIAVAEAPLGFMLACVVGAALWLAGIWLQKVLDTRADFPVLWIVLAVFVLSGLVLVLTSNVIGSLATALSVAFLRVSPKQRRPVATTEMGPLFSFVMLVVATGAAMCLAGYVITRSGPAVALAPAIGLPTEFYARPTLAGIAVMFLMLIPLVSPLWAAYHRIGAPAVVAAGLRMVGAIMGVGGLMTAVAMGPVCVYVDRSLADTLSQLVANEPVYYLVQ